MVWNSSFTVERRTSGGAAVVLASTIQILLVLRLRRSRSNWATCRVLGNRSSIQVSRYSAPSLT